eukprot:gene6469-13064_t
MKIIEPPSNLFMWILSCLLIFACASAYRQDNSLRFQNQNGMLSRKCIKLRDITFTPDTEAIATAFIPPEVGAEIYIGTVAGLIPIVWATYEFTNRIRIQRECLVCKGSGLTNTTRTGNTLNKLRKCWSCGGFLPWLGWKRFFLSSVLDVGNGGVLQRPAQDYKQINDDIRKKNLKNNEKD